MLPLENSINAVSNLCTCRGSKISLEVFVISAAWTTLKIYLVCHGGIEFLEGEGYGVVFSVAEESKIFDTEIGDGAAVDWNQQVRGGLRDVAIFEVQGGEVCGH